MSRERLFQGPPDPDRDYRSFPARNLPVGHRVYRVHWESLGPWWFSSTGDGRFDLSPPHGTCYLSGTQAGALRELTGPDIAAHGFVEQSVLDGRVISGLELPEAVRAANISSNLAATRFGVTAELATMVPYDVPQRWSWTVHRAGFGGLVFTMRFSPGGGEGLALFGTAGEAPWPVDDKPTPSESVARRLKMTVVPPPDDESVTILNPTI